MSAFRKSAYGASRTSRQGGSVWFYGYSTFGGADG
jgi:hypothetical protein